MWNSKKRLFLAAALAAGASASAHAETITYTYDVHGQVVTAARSGGTTSTYAYDNAANRSSVTSAASGARAAAVKSSPATTRPTWSDFKEESATTAPATDASAAKSPGAK